MDNQTNRQLFHVFLKELQLPERVKVDFDAYHQAIREINTYVNLISRKMPEAEYWFRLYLDSLLPLRLMDFSGMRVLDFGSGGGFPGIPLKIVMPDMEIFLLDSRGKKIAALKKIVKMLDLKRCNPVHSRFEEIGKNQWQGYFDAIVCRSVRIETVYLANLKRLLTDSGRLFLYKSGKADDIDLFDKVCEQDISHPRVGERRIIIIEKKDIRRIGAE
ncbi:MAG: 16S rRNA (guanine(527)-N(7))-methyltransferase RsmG [Candidatus Cloacimonetes bacterium]|nr:16S rRNA (guanine(527)-N(7))-methyltransferase RsmG [Candidatus Cloacimonadota bacterium]